MKSLSNRITREQQDKLAAQAVETVRRYCPMPAPASMPWGNAALNPAPKSAFKRFYHGGQRPADALDLAIADARERKLGEFESALIQYRDQRATLVEALKGIAEYGRMCKGTDAQRMTYLAKQALSPYA